jgi:hypothetical protein
VSGASVQDNKFVIVRGLSDRYNSAMLNSALLPSSEPDKKAFSFDMFPAALIDNIIINKTATPEFTGEFTGGVVQVNTKDIPAKDVLTVGFGLGYNTNQPSSHLLATSEINMIGWDLTMEQETCPIVSLQPPNCIGHSEKMLRD